MKKVSILALHLNYGGIEKSIAALANILCEKYIVEISCCYKLIDEPAFFIDKRVKVKYLLSDMRPNRELFKSLLQKKKFFSAFKEGLYALKVLYFRRKEMISYIANCDSDIIIATRDIFDEWLGEYGNESILKIGWEHNHHHNNFKYAKSIVRASANLDYLVLVSKELRDFYEKQLSQFNCKCLYIPNIVDDLPKRKSQLEEKRLVSVGRLSPEKGFIDLLKVFNFLLKKHPDWKLDIIGDGRERNRLEKYIVDHDLEKNVILHGFRDKDYIGKVFKKSSVYVMTSFTESFGIVLIEAMSYGIPCVAFDSAEGANDIINSGANGFLIKNRSLLAMVDAIEKLMQDRDMRIKFGVVARNDSKKYTSSVVAKDWYSLLNKR